MKNFKSIKKGLALLAFSSIGIIGHTQSADDLLRLSSQDVQGTARFSGMGGAFTALGGDFGSLSINPAGIGLYRKSEFSITPTISSTTTNTTYLGSKIGDNRVRFGLSNLGYVGNYSYGKQSGLVSVSYALGYNKTMDFHRFAPMQGFNSESSILDAYAEDANFFFVHPADQQSPNGWNEQEFIRTTSDRDLYQELGVDEWLSGAAVATELLNNNFNDRIPPSSTNVNQFLSVLYPNERVNQFRHNKRSGSTGEYVMSFGANISNKFYIGATLGMQDLRYEDIISYSEDGDPALSKMELDVDEFIRTTGFGINGKFGFIFRPVHMFRIGAAIHTPTYYEMEETYAFDMTGNSQGGRPISTGSVFSNVYNYRMQTPLRAEFGVAVVLGQLGLVSVDYELVNYKGMRMRDNQFSSHVREVNEDIRNDFRTTSNIRIGGELHLGFGILVRAGFNYLQSPFSGDSRNPDSPFFDKLGITINRPHRRDFDRFMYACGVGYRDGSFFTDFAYTLNTGNYYYLPYGGAAGVARENERRSRFMLTIGFRF